MTLAITRDNLKAMLWKMAWKLNKDFFSFPQFLFFVFIYLFIEFDNYN